ncbi:Transposable element tcb1 transposase [Caligus rogercresseyi]|uniref:Transposable element tcb1 transposase n=1 Tax=Caligus rogercresseyi TaxID=217165 RepID=A0A7T8QU26_CALRO|nr:Transposable element tcb1 transposase [Caligus rogercresseyi]
MAALGISRISSKRRLNLPQALETSAGSSMFISDLVEAFRDATLMWCVVHTSLPNLVVVAWVQVVEVPEVGHILLQPGLHKFGLMGVHRALLECVRGLGGHTMDLTLPGF